MLKNIMLVMVLLFTFSSYTYAGDKGQQDNDKVEKTLKKMVRAYKNENLRAFFTHVSEDKFQQDFLDFAEYLKDDLRVNDILSLDVWVDKITSDGKKRFLYITWEKRYQNSEESSELFKEGRSMFLFDNIKGKYKLIDFGGDILFGNN